MPKTLKDVQKLIKDKGIKMVDFKLTDIDGSNYGYAPIENSDMVFIPVLESAVIDRYSEIPTLSMIGDVKIIDLPKNRPFDQYPRNVAIKLLTKYKLVNKCFCTHCIFAQ